MKHDRRAAAAAAAEAAEAAANSRNFVHFNRFLVKRRFCARDVTEIAWRDADESLAAGRLTLPVIDYGRFCYVLFAAVLFTLDAGGDTTRRRRRRRRRREQIK